MARERGAVSAGAGAVKERSLVWVSRQRPTCVLPCPGEREPELSSAARVSFHAAGLGRQTRPLVPSLEPGLAARSCSGSAGLPGEQVSRDRDTGSAWLETWLRCWDAQLSDRSCEMWWLIALLTGWLPWRSSGEAVSRTHHHPAGRHGAGRGQMVPLQPAGRSRARFSRC